MAGYIYEVGDVVTLKKSHPCGSHEWEILRVGADFRLKCEGCGHQIMVPRKLVEKNTRNLQKNLIPETGYARINARDILLPVTTVLTRDVSLGSLEKRDAQRAYILVPCEDRGPLRP